MARLELVTECAHGKTDSQMGIHSDIYNGCPGGSRIPLDPDRRIVTDRYMDFRSGVPMALTVQDVLDALEEPDVD